MIPGRCSVKFEKQCTIDAIPPKMVTQGSFRPSLALIQYTAAVRTFVYVDSCAHLRFSIPWRNRMLRSIEGDTLHEGIDGAGDPVLNAGLNRRAKAQFLRSDFVNYCWPERW